MRSSGFKGAIVLISGRLQYIQDEETEQFQYGVSIPFNANEIEGFLSFLNKIKSEGFIYSQTNDKETKDLQNEIKFKTPAGFFRP